MKKLTKKQWEWLSELAWEARSHGHIYEDTLVGAAVLYDNNKVAVGCNVEHKFRSHDFHAETNAIGNMIVSGGKKIHAVLVVAERIRLTPCGACRDWINQFGTPDTEIAIQKKKNGPFTKYTLKQLAPYFPI